MYASFGRRLGAMMLDTIIMTAINIAILFVGFVILGSAGSGLEELSSGQNLENYRAATLTVILLLLIFFLSLFYEVIFHAIWGATPGKMLLSMKVTMENGDKISFTTSFIRYLVETWPFWLVFFFKINASERGGIDSVNLIWMVISAIVLMASSKKKAIHDYVAGTIVVIVR